MTISNVTGSVASSLTSETVATAVVSTLVTPAAFVSHVTRLRPWLSVGSAPARKFVTAQVRVAPPSPFSATDTSALNHVLKPSMS